MRIDELPPVEIPGHRASGLGSDDHPMRIMSRRAAGLAPGGWDAEARGRVETTFDELSSEWHTRTSAQRTAVVIDALDRGGVTGGGVTGGGVAIEVGSGIGNYSGLLAKRFGTVAAVDEVSIGSSESNTSAVLQAQAEALSKLAGAVAGAVP